MKNNMVNEEHFSSEGVLVPNVETFVLGTSGPKNQTDVQTLPLAIGTPPAAAGVDVITAIQAVFTCRKVLLKPFFFCCVISLSPPSVCVCRRVPTWPLCVRVHAHGLASLWVALNSCVNQGRLEPLWIAPSLPTVIGAICLGYVHTVAGMLASIIHSFPPYCGRKS